MSPTPPPMKKRLVPPPPPPPKKKQREKAPAEKLPYDMTDEECKAAAAAEHEKWQQACKEAWLKKQNLEPPLDKRKLRSFIRRMEAEQRKNQEKPSLSDYDRQITKQAAHKRKKSRNLFLNSESNPTNQLPRLWCFLTLTKTWLNSLKIQI